MSSTFISSSISTFLVDLVKFSPFLASSDIEGITRMCANVWFYGVDEDGGVLFGGDEFDGGEPRGNRGVMVDVGPTFGGAPKESGGGC